MQSMHPEDPPALLAVLMAVPKATPEVDPQPMVVHLVAPAVDSASIHLPALAELVAQLVGPVKHQPSFLVLPLCLSLFADLGLLLE